LKAKVILAMTLLPLVAAVLLLIPTLCLQCAGIAVLVEWLRRVVAPQIHKFSPTRSAVLVVQSAIAIIALHGLVILLWACFYRSWCFASWELAFYFSASSYATVGYGDVILPIKWRLLGPLESMTGLLMCGVSVCVLFALITRLVESDTRYSQKQMEVAGSRAGSAHSGKKGHA
jgi:voltage-gated potassium channel